MLWRHLCLVRACTAAGLLTGAILGSAVLAGTEPAEPTPSAEGTATVGILDAQKSGDVQLKVRGQGEDRVRFSVQNTTSKRLRVVLPPGLVAANATGQLQSMGLGTPTNGPGSFGSFRPTAPEPGLRSVPAEEGDRPDTVAVPAGQTVEFSVRAVCLNYGLPTPTPHDSFELMDVDEYTPDPRVRKALRTLATLGTSHGVAQAVMWNVCNNVPFGMMSRRFGKEMNSHELALAGRFIEALDSSGSGEVMDSAYLTEGRVYVQIRAEGALAADAKRLSEALEGQRILGLPVRAVADNETPNPKAPAIMLSVNLTPGRPGETHGRVAVRRGAGSSGWLPTGQASFATGSASSELTAEELTRAVDHAVAASFVSVKPTRRGVGSTTLKIENRLPFTLKTVVVKAGNSAGAPSVALPGLGIGPARSGLAPIEAATGTVDRVELNGL